MKRKRDFTPKLRYAPLSLAVMLILALAIFSSFDNFAFANMIPVEPISEVFILSNGSVEPSTPLIVAQGNFYAFTGDFTNTTIVVERDGITLDGAGHSMTGHSTYYQQAIDISNRTNITVKNVVINQFGSGILMDHASNNTLSENQMSTFAAFNMINADNNHIVGNTVTQGYGIYGSGSYNLIMNNSFSGGLSGGGNGMGIYLSGSNNTITLNTIIHGVSINIGGSQYNTISNNTILNGGSGILLARSSNNIVCGNIISGKTDSRSGALYISSDSVYNVVFQNNFENNALAIALGAKVVSSVWNNVYDNRFYENDFLNNTQNVWIAPGAPVNYWDNGQQGNYWSNFQGVDSNHDGISETPYIINANNTDNHPLMTPYVINAVNQDYHSLTSPINTGASSQPEISATSPSQPSPSSFTFNAQLFSMPEEQVNYTITQIDDAMWAKIDGTYPIEYTGNETSIPMVYPVPPGTTNIYVWMNDCKLNWSNFTEANPKAIHHTAIGDWQEILTVLENVSGGFVLRIHYEHPLQVINGSYKFLYDLNIQEYLSAACNSSVAHFSIAIDLNYANLKVNTVDSETEALKPIDYVTLGDKNDVIRIDEVSEFGKALPGDLLVSFSAAEMNGNGNFSMMVAAIAVGLFFVSSVSALVYWKKRKHSSEFVNKP